MRPAMSTNIDSKEYTNAIFISDRASTSATPDDGDDIFDANRAIDRAIDICTIALICGTKMSFPVAMSMTIDSKEYTDAITIVDRASTSAAPGDGDDLFDAVRVIDRNALMIYPDDESKEELWKKESSPLRTWR